MMRIKTRRYSFVSVMVGLWAGMLAGQAHAEVQQLSNGLPGIWELVEREGNRQCFVRTKIVGAAGLDTVDLDRELGGRKLELRLHGQRTGKPSVSITAGYVIASGSTKTQPVTEFDDSDGRRSVEMEFISDEAVAIAQGSPVSLAVTREQVITIDTKGVVGLLPALDACGRNYLIELGADTRMVARVAIDPYVEDSIISADDYPASALRRGEQGEVVALAIIDPTGAARECRIVRSSGSAALDGATCDALKRAKFEPGLDALGKAVEAPALFGVHWVL